MADGAQEVVEVVLVLVVLVNDELVPALEVVVPEVEDELDLLVDDVLTDVLTDELLELVGPTGRELDVVLE